MNADLKAHMQTGLTHICRCWKISRKDGAVLGFTDHDQDLIFDGTTFQAGAGLSPAAIVQATGLSVDNSEAIGALDSERLTEADIRAGLFDGAQVVAYLVNWQDPNARAVSFRGQLGEITRSGGQFRAEIRALSEFLNQPGGRVYQKPCAAVLGDSACGFNTLQPGYFADGVIGAVLSGSQIRVTELDGFAERWFERGLVVYESQGYERRLSVKKDQSDGDSRIITLWRSPPEKLTVGTSVRLLAGCDRRMETCLNKFNNVVNFRGFPDLPGEDWVMKLPTSGQVHDGGSLR